MQQSAGQIGGQIVYTHLVLWQDRHEITINTIGTGRIMEMKKGSHAAGMGKSSAPKKDRIGPMRPIKTGQRPKSNFKKLG